MEPFLAKGKSAPVVTFAVGARSSPRVDDCAGGDTRRIFIGRADHVDAILGAARRPRPVPVE